MYKQFGFIGNLLLYLVKLFSKSLPVIDTQNKKRLEFFLKFSALILYAWSKKIWVIPFSIYRTAEQQNEKFKAGRTLCDGYNRQSKHQLWRASDILVLDDNLNSAWDVRDKYLILAIFWEAIGGTWGYRWYEQGKVDFKDYYHFEI